MTDRKLLEAAARAAGMRLVLYNHTTGAMGYEGSGGKWWNPLLDDGDAFRLMARLNINVYYRENINGAFVIADHEGIEFCPESLDGPHEDSATRRAIVRAAASMGGEE